MEGNIDASVARSAVLWKRKVLMDILPLSCAHHLARLTASDHHYAGSPTAIVSTPVVAAIGGLESGGPGKKDIRESG